ncbi:MAG: hypothetical protein AAF449_22290 [Myxococcota bacterium]
MYQWWAALMFVVGSACVEPESANGAPSWASSQAWTEDGRFAYAVGRVQRIRNPALARSTADARARVALSRHLEAIGSTAAIDRLRSVEIVDHWIDADGTVYALARFRF